MVFAGPPGTGKSMWAKVVGQILVKMSLIPSDTVVEVANPLELQGMFVGHTAPIVDRKVEEAHGGILFIDEAYSLMNVQKHGSETSQFAKEAIDTIMKHLDPPSCVFIFAGYEQPMDDFLKLNEGLARRIPYR